MIIINSNRELARNIGSEAGGTIFFFFARVEKNLRRHYLG